MLPSPPFLRGAAAAVALVLAAGCGVDPALQVHVALTPAVKASCVQLSVFTAADVSGAPAESTWVARPPGKDEVYLAVYKGALPSQVWVTARPLWGAECQEPLLPNGAPAVVSGSFPPSGVTPVELALSAPSAAEDKDGDGFIGPPGADCNDDLGAVNPGTAERCQEPGDFDCDGRIGCADPGCPASACLPSPTALAFVTPAKTLVAGACSGTPVTVQTRDGTGALLAVVAPTPVTLLSPDSTLQIFSDSQCQTPLSNVTIPAGGSSVSAYISGTVAGSGLLQASAPGLGSVTQTEAIQPAATSQVVFTSTPQTVALGGCSQAVTAQLRDAFGNPTPVGATRLLSLSSNGGGSFRFYLDAACATPAVTQAPVLAGASAATFYFKSTAATGGTVTITVADGPRTANQAVTLVQLTPTQLAFTTGPFSVLQGACSPAVTLQTQDGTGQPAPVGTALNVGLSVAPGGALTFYSDAGCTTAVTQVTIGVGLNSASFHFMGTQQGTATITAAGGAFGSPQQTETISAPQPTRLAFTTAAQTSVVAGQCSGPVDIDAQGPGGTAIPVAANTSINLATNPNGQLSLYAGAGCGGPLISAVTMAAGTSRVTISFRGTVAGNTTITASTAGSTLAQAQQGEGVVAAAAAKVRIVSGGGQTVGVNTCSGAVTFELQDAFNNPVTAASAEVVDLSVTPSGAATFSLTGDCAASSLTAQVSAGAQRGSFYFRGGTPQSITVTVTPQTGSLTGDSAPQTIQVVGPTQLRFTSAAQSAVRAGTCSADVVLTTYDAANSVSPVTADTPVSLSATGLPGPVSFFAGSGCSGAAVTTVTIPNGSSSVSYSFSTNRSGSGNLAAAATGLSSATQAVTVVPGAPSQLRFSLGPVTVAAGSCSGPQSPLAIQAQDSLGNPSPVAANLDVALSAANPATTQSITFYNNNCGGGGTTTVRISAGNHTSGTFAFRTNGAGTWAFTGSATGLASATQDETVTPLAPSKLAFVTPAQTLPVSQCSAIVTFQLQDTYGNASPPSSSTNVSLAPGGDTFYSQPNCTGAISGNTITLNAGVAGGSYYFRAPGSAGNYTIDVSTSGGITSASQTETIQ